MTEEEAKRRRAVNRKRKRLLPAGPLTLNDWYSTPEVIFRALNSELGPFTLDAAASPENAKVPLYYTAEQNGLVQPWRASPEERGVVFVNPPYGLSLRQWIEKAVAATNETTDEAETVAMLLPLYGDVRWFHEVVLPHVSDLIFIRGRLKFHSPAVTGSKACPNPSFVAVFRRGRPATRTATMTSDGEALVWH